MRKLMAVLAAAGMMVIGSGVDAAALSLVYNDAAGGPYTFEATGEYLFTVLDSNINSPDDLETALFEWDGTVVDFDFFAGANYGDPSTGDFTLNVTYADDGLSGTWDTGVPPLFDVSYYTVKGGNDYAVYLVDPAAGSGTWNTERLLVGNGNTPQISHFSSVGTPASVPEPGTLLLLGTGLLGLGLVRRKK